MLNAVIAYLKEFPLPTGKLTLTFVTTWSISRKMQARS